MFDALLSIAGIPIAETHSEFETKDLIRDKILSKRRMNHHLSDVEYLSQWYFASPSASATQIYVYINYFVTHNVAYIC